MEPRVYKAPETLPFMADGLPFDQTGTLLNKSVFLAGSIEMGKAPDWQSIVTPDLLALGWSVFNPRRDDWDSSWVQSIHNVQFREQVEWELDAMDIAERVLMYFAPGTQSPITLLELGLMASENPVQEPFLWVVCPEGFWRRGNVEIVCARHGVPFFDNLLDAMRDFSKDA